MKLLSNLPSQGPCVAQVTFSQEDEFGASSGYERRKIPTFSARGITYRPCQGDHVLLFNVAGKEVCAGVLCQSEKIEPGELSLSSSGGANIHLKADGSVVINGLTITSDGQLIPPL